MKYPYLHKKTIMAEAKKLREDAFGNARFPLDLEYLVFDFLNLRDGLIFYEDEELGFSEGSRILGCMEPLSKKIKICSSLINGNLGRRRFTIAHEIGHWILHRHLFNEDQEELLPKQSLITLERNLENHDKLPNEEWQANAFASWLLIGELELKEKLKERYASLPLECEGDLVQKAWDVSTETGMGPALWECFGVPRVR